MVPRGGAARDARPLRGDFLNAQAPFSAGEGWLGVWVLDNSCLLRQDKRKGTNPERSEPGEEAAREGKTWNRNCVKKLKSRNRAGEI